MNTMLKTAYTLGAQQAEQDFEKDAQGYGYDDQDYGMGSVGALPPELMQLMSSPYGQAVQGGAQQGPRLKEQLSTALRGVGGGVAGGVGGAALGGALGYGGGHLANALGADLDEDQIRQIMIYSALAGGGLGVGAGGMGGGAVLGQKEGSAKVAAGADIATPIAGAFGTLPAALVGGLSSPEGRGFAGGAGAGGGAFLGQLGGGLGGAALGGALGGGGAALYNALRSDPSLLERLMGEDHRIDPGNAAAIGAALGGTAGMIGGGAYGAYKGRRLGVGDA